MGQTCAQAFCAQKSGCFLAVAFESIVRKVVIIVKVVVIGGTLIHVKGHLQHIYRAARAYRVGGRQHHVHVVRIVAHHVG